MLSCVKKKRHRLFRMHSVSLLVLWEINDLIKVKSCIVLIGYSQELEENKLILVLRVLISVKWELPLRVASVAEKNGLYRFIF